MLLVYLSLIDSPNHQDLFEDIYNTYRKQMFLLAKSIAKNDSDAEDIVHDVFLKIATKHISSIEAIHDPVDLRNYLLKATKNTALNYVKKRDKSNVSIDLLLEKDIQNYPDLTDNAFIDWICANSDYHQLVLAILSLGSPYSDVMYYHFVLGFSIPETSKHLNRKAATVKMQLVRGKKILLLKLGHGGDDSSGNH